MRKIKSDLNLFVCFLILGYSNLLIFEFGILKENLLIDFLGDQIAYENIVRIIDEQRKWNWIKYLLFPLLSLLKFTLISFWILSASLFLNFKINFKSIFRVVLISEFVWFIPSFLLLVWFGLFHTSYSLIEIQYFAPLSLLSFFDASQLDSWLIFPLKSLNLFEVIYILVLALGFKNIMKKDYDSALKFTLPVYGSALVVWILFVTFLSINLGA